MIDNIKKVTVNYNERIVGYTLSPAYDLTRVPDKFEHEMTVNGNGNPTKDDLLAVAKAFKLSTTKCKRMMDEIETICKAE